MRLSIHVDVPLGIMRALNLVIVATFNFLIVLLASQARMILTMGKGWMHFMLVDARNAEQEKAALRLLQSVGAASPVSTAMVWEIASNVPAANSRYRSEPRMLTRVFLV